MLRDVSGTGHGDVWAVGHSIRADRHHALVQHWDGRAWRLVQIPQVAGRENAVHAVHARTPTDAWAVGEAWDRATGDYDPLILHWDGVEWSLVPSPVADGVARDVVALSAREVWVVGTRGAGGQLLARWTGSRWVVRDEPAEG